MTFPYYLINNILLSRSNFNIQLKSVNNYLLYNEKLLNLYYYPLEKRWLVLCKKFGRILCYSIWGMRFFYIYIYDSLFEKRKLMEIFFQWRVLIEIFSLLFEKGIYYCIRQFWVDNKVAFNFEINFYIKWISIFNVVCLK